MHFCVDGAPENAVQQSHSGQQVSRERVDEPNEDTRNKTHKKLCRVFERQIEQSAWTFFVVEDVVTLSVVVHVLLPRSIKVGAAGQLCQLWSVHEPTVGDVFKQRYGQVIAGETKSDVEW